MGPRWFAWNEPVGFLTRDRQARNERGCAGSYHSIEATKREMSETFPHLLVPQEGLEPPWAIAHYALNVARLPIPPLRRTVIQL